MTRRGCAVGPRIESRPHEPAVRAGRGLVDATDAGPAHRPSALLFLFQGCSSVDLRNWPPIRAPVVKPTTPPRTKPATVPAVRSPDSPRPRAHRAPKTPT